MAPKNFPVIVALLAIAAVFVVSAGLFAATPDGGGPSPTTSAGDDTKPEDCPKPKENSKKPINYATGMMVLSAPLLPPNDADNWDASLVFRNHLVDASGAASDFDGPVGTNVQLGGNTSGMPSVAAGENPIQYGPSGALPRTYFARLSIPGVGWASWEYMSALPVSVPHPILGNIDFRLPSQPIVATSGMHAYSLVAVPVFHGSWTGDAYVAYVSDKVADGAVTTTTFEGDGKWTSTRATNTPGDVAGSGVISNTGYNSEGTPLGTQWSVFRNDQVVYYETVNTFVTSGDNINRVESTTLKRKVGSSGAWVNLYKIAYVYYNSYSTCGNNGDLMLATSYRIDGSTVTSIAETYMRYYKPGDAHGYVHGLKMILGPDAVTRLRRTPGSGDHTPDDYVTEADAKAVADHYFEYNSQHQVSLEIASGGCSSCGGASTSGDKYSYAVRPSYTPRSSDTTPNDDRVNSWKTKTSVEYADGSTEVVYANFHGDVMLNVKGQKDSSDHWCDYYAYSEAGDLSLHAYPSAVDFPGFSTVEGIASLLDYDEVNQRATYVRDNAGLVEVASWAGNHVPRDKLLFHGDNNETSVAHISHSENETHTDGSESISNETSSVTFPDGTTPVSTSFSYTFQGSTNKIASRSTTRPVVSASAQNGSGSADVSSEVYDSAGNVIWRKDERGRITAYQWDTDTGKLAQVIDDCNISLSHPNLSTAPTGWTSPGDALELVTDMSYDKWGRLVERLGPPVSVVANADATSSSTVRPAEYHVYKESDTGNEEWIGTGYKDGASYTVINPVAITKLEKSIALERISAKRTSGSGKLVETDGFAQSGWTAWSVNQSASNGLVTSIRRYHVIPSSGVGAAGTNFLETKFGYDELGRRVRNESPGGQITRSVFDVRGKLASTWVGTTDSSTWTPSAPGSSDLVKVAENEYDGGVSGGDENLTKVTRYENSIDTRVTAYTYDWRNRKETTTGEVDAFAKIYYDNVNRVIKSERYNTNSAGTLLARTESSYDDRGRVFQRKSYAVSSGGTPGNALTSNYWYDSGGNLIKSVDAGAGKTFAKATYDGLNRVLKTYVGYDTAETSYADAGTVSGDTIFEQSEVTYDASGNVVSTTALQRRHDATGTGALTSGSNPKARVSFTASWFDALGRCVASVDYGTNGGSVISRPSVVPARSDTVLVSSAFYDDAGDASRQFDPKAIETRIVTDAAGRTTKVIEAYDDGDPLMGATDRDRVTEYTYTADNQVKTLTAKNASTGDQVTTYAYGSTASEGYPSTTLLRGVIYPDSDDTVSNNGTTNVSMGNGTDVTFDRVEMKYNRLGQVLERKDQNGTTHAYVYDKLGRLTQDEVPTFASGSSIDQAIKRIARTYTPKGQLERITSYDSATAGSGTVKNEVQLAYNDFGQLAIDYQGVNGVVNTSTTPKTGYAYTDGSSGSNQVRLSTITYPISGRAITYDYGTSGGTDDILSRPHAIKEGSTTLQVETYLGGGTIVKLSSPQVALALDYTAGTDYDALDRFGRVLSHKWTYIQVDGGSTLTADEFAYGYDRDSNRIYNAHINATNRDQFYAYDTLNRLTSRARGSLNGTNTGISGTPSEEESWSLDSLGNWSGYGTKTAGTATLTQTRSHNKADEIAVSGIGETVGSAWADPVHDKTGNMTTMPLAGSPTTSLNATYDAWNRMTSATAGSSGPAYTYDGLGRRITNKPYDAVLKSYYSGWRMIEELDPSDSNRSYVWGLRYIDELVCQERFEGKTEALVDEVYYAVQDANFNVTSEVSFYGYDDATRHGQLVTRFSYTPYGQRTTLNANFTTAGFQGSSNHPFGHQGLRHDDTTGLIYNRARYLHPGLGRFTGRDPLGYFAGSNNLFQYLNSNATNLLDPSGGEPQTTQPTTQDSRNCCEKYADAIAEVFEKYREQAKNAVNWKNEVWETDMYPLMTGIAENWMPTTTPHKIWARDVLMGRWPIDLNSRPPRKPFDGMNPCIDGFRPELIAGGQDSDVYAHITASMLLSLTNDKADFEAANDVDVEEYEAAEKKYAANPNSIVNRNDWLQKRAEYAGNAQGWDMGQDIRDFITGKINADQLRQKLKEKACSPH